MASRGKEFEKRLKSALCEVPNAYTLRLIDSFGFTENPSDFIFFKDGTLYLIEAKSHEGNVFPLKMVSPNQWKYLNVGVAGVKSFVIIWFVSHDVTRLFDFKYLLGAKNNDIKSIRYDDEHGIVVPAIKKRSYFEYNLKGVF